MAVPITYLPKIFDMTGAQNRLHQRFVRFGRTLHQSGEVIVPAFRGFVSWILPLGCAALLVATPLRAQENLDEGKTPAQMFNSDCSICHNSPSGLSKTSDTRAVAGFLRQHYTASRETAGALAAFLTGQADRTGRQRAPAIGRPAERAAPAERVAPAAPTVRRGGLFGFGADDTAKPDPRDEPPAPASRQRRPPRAIEAARPSEAKPSEAKPAEAKPSETKPSEAGEEKKDEAAKPEPAKPDAKPRRASRSETAPRPAKPVDAAKDGAKPAEGTDDKKDEQPEIARPERPESKPEAKPRRQVRPTAPKDAAKDAAKDAPKPASSSASAEPKPAPAAAPAEPPAPPVPARTDDIAD
jgi:hypothetical protein